MSRFAEVLNIFIIACQRLVEELESSVKTNCTLLDDVLFEKRRGLISVMVSLFEFFSLLATALRKNLPAAP